jgi:hypothetical protein
VATDDKRAMLRHFLAALAYRTQKALRDAPPEFAEFDAGSKVRTSKELVDPARLGPDQAMPASPDADWPEAPPGWTARR